MEIFNDLQQEIAEKMMPECNISNWKDWKWQLKNSVRTIEDFELLTGIAFTHAEKQRLEATLGRFPLSITPYYLSLIDTENYRNDPVFIQAFANIEELTVLKTDLEDPLHEEDDSPVEGITHRYPDRVLFHVSNVCSMYCRFCTRKRKVGDVDSIPSKKQLERGIEYIKNTPEVRDVLLSGGDPLMLPDSYLDWLLTEIKAIPHVEIVRLGTRMPVVLPYRITDNLVKVLQKHHPLWINTF